MPLDRHAADLLSDDATRPLDCERDSDCRLGCHCLDGGCALIDPAADPTDGYCARGPAPTCMAVPDLVVETLEDRVDGSDGVRSLREALQEAASAAGPHRVTFAGALHRGELTVDESLGPLPELGSLTYLDGAGVTLRAGGAGADLGLRLRGGGVVVSDLTLLGFTTAAITVLPGTSDVHLFHLRVGDLGQPPNGDGIAVHPGSRRVWIGRGRELACVDWSYLPLPADEQSFDVGSYDLNVIAANQGDGIRVEQASEVYIYGTWVGFDNLYPEGNQHDAPAWGNHQHGIHLIDVFDAVVGIQYLGASEGGGRAHDPLAAGVAVGRSGQGGVLIERGGEISMPGLILGDTPPMTIYDENSVFNLKIEDSAGPVVYGRPPGLGRQSSPLYSLSHSEGTLPIWVQGNQDEVLIWGLQNQCYYGASCPDHAVVIEAAAAAVRIYHTTNLFDFRRAAIQVGSLLPGGSVEVVNNIFWDRAPSSVVALEAGADTAEGVELRNNVLFNYGGWCLGDCPVLPTSNTVGDPDLCDFYYALPQSPACAAVDTGEELRWSGLVLDRNGDREGTFNGCAPDLGARECVSEPCLAACH